MVEDKNVSKEEGKYWEDVISDLSEEGLDFRKREDFIAKDPKYYWEDARIIKKVLAHPRETLKNSVTKEMKALDLGSGSGGNSYIMAKLGAEVLGVDVQEKTIENLNREIAKEPNLKLKFEVMDLNKPEFPENEYDLVLSWNSFHHIKNTDGLIEEMKKAMKPGASFVLFEHQHTDSKLRKMLAAFFWLVLPTREKLKEKWKIIRSRSKGASEVELSPAEDSAPEDYLERLKKAFLVKEEKSYFGFTSPFIARIRGPQKVRSFLVSMVNAIDQALIKMKILKGEQIFLILKNKE